MLNGSKQDAKTNRTFGCAIACHHLTKHVVISQIISEERQIPSSILKKHEGISSLISPPIMIVLAAQHAGRPDLIRSPKRVLAHTWKGL